MIIVSDGEVLKVPSGSSTSQEVYSTEEQQIGTWIDGKPVYRKVYLTTSTSSTGQGSLNVDTSELSIDAVVRLDAILQRSVSSQNNKYNIDVFFSTSRILYANISEQNYTSQPLVVILEYTKTTDSAATGSAAFSYDIPDDYPAVAATCSPYNEEV